MGKGATQETRGGAHRSAMAFPMPREAPVMKSVFPLSDKADEAIVPSMETKRVKRFRVFPRKEPDFDSQIL